MTNGEKIVKAAMLWIGAHHRNGQMTRYIAIDCALMYLACLEDAGLVEKGSIYIKPYSAEWYLHHSDEKMLQYFEQICDEVPEDNLQPGDALLYQFGRCIGHAGIYVGNGLSIHALALEDSVILCDMNDAKLLYPNGKPRLRKVMRFNREKYEKHRLDGTLGDRRE